MKPIKLLPRNSSGQLTIDPQYTLTNIQSCLDMWIDCCGTSQKVLKNAAIKWIAHKLEVNNELTFSDKEEFHTKFYLEMKNK